MTKYSIQAHIDSTNLLYEDKHCTLVYLGEQVPDVFNVTEISNIINEEFPHKVALETKLTYFGPNNDIPVQRVVDDNNYLYNLNRDLMEYFAKLEVFPRTDYVNYVPHISLGIAGEFVDTDSLQEVVILTRPSLVMWDEPRYIGL